METFLGGAAFGVVFVEVEAGRYQCTTWVLERRHCVCSLCFVFMFCILLQIFTSKLVREVLVLTYNANIGSCDCVRFAGALC